MRKLLLFFFSLGIFHPLLSQHEYSDFQTTARAGVGTTFVEDYNTLGINVANLAKEPFFKDKPITIGFLAFNLTFFTAPLSKVEAIGAFGDNENLTYEEKAKNAVRFIAEPITMNLDYLLFGASYYHPKVGGFAFSIRDKVQWFSKFDTKAADMMFLGFNSSYFDQIEISSGNGQSQIIQNSDNLSDSIRSLITKGVLSDTSLSIKYSNLIGETELSMVAYREYSLGFGRKIIEKGDFNFEGGIGLKYIAGYNMTEIRNKDGQFEAYGAFSPWLDIDFGAAASSNPTSQTQKRLGFGGFNVVGKGFGLDLGFNVEYRNRSNLGIAINNLGFIRWDKNLYTATDDKIIDLDNGGFETLNFFTEAQKFGGDDGLFKWKSGEKRTVNLQPNMRIGLSQEIGNTIQAGMDIILPLNDQPGGLDKPIISFGGDFTPFKIIRASTGFTYGGNFDSRVLIPVGCSFMIAQGTYEIGAATRDIVTYFRQKGPVLSVGFGFFKFRF